MADFEMTKDTNMDDIYIDDTCIDDYDYDVKLVLSMIIKCKTLKAL